MGQGPGSVWAEAPRLGDQETRLREGTDLAEGHRSELEPESGALRHHHVTAAKIYSQPTIKGQERASPLPVSVPLQSVWNTISFEVL